MRPLLVTAIFIDSRLTSSPPIQRLHSASVFIAGERVYQSQWVESETLAAMEGALWLRERIQLILDPSYLFNNQETELFGTDDDVGAK